MPKVRVVTDWEPRCDKGSHQGQGYGDVTDPYPPKAGGADRRHPLMSAKARPIWIAAGPNRTMKSDGKMQKTRGNTIFTGAAKAFS
jgi:hypothetical protein